MSARADPLRNTLDHLTLDPRAKADQKYLESMLRRLGYTEVEIRQALGKPVEESRVIEIEYRKARSGAGAFTVVEDAPEPEPVEAAEPEYEYVPEPEEEFTFSAPTTDDAGWEPVEEAPEPVAEHVEDDAAWEAAPEWETTEEPGPAWEPAEEPAPQWELGEEPAMEDGDEAVVHGWIPLDGDRVVRGADVDNPWEDAESDADAAGWEDADTGADGPAWEEGVEFIERDPAAAAAWPETEEPQFEEPQFAEPQWETDETAWPEPPAEWTDPHAGRPVDPWAAETPQMTDAAAPSEAAFQYGEYTLYTRMVDLSSGRQQQIYFFAKSEPKSGQACLMPPGYMVEANERTGLPFLRRDPNHVEGVAAPEAPVEEAPLPEAEPVQDVVGHCLATTKQGDPCKKAPMEGSEYCNIHKGRD